MARIIKRFICSPGECRKDKVIAAIADIVEQRRLVNELRHSYNDCKKVLRHLVLKSPTYKGGKELFYNIDQCTAAAECKLPTWILRLEEKKCKLEDELKWYQGTFGRIYDYGKFHHFSRMLEYIGIRNVVYEDTFKVFQ